MLGHSSVKRNIVILAPSAEWVEEEDWVLVSELDELLSGVLEEEHVSVVEWVSHLEGVAGIGVLGLDEGLDLSWGLSVRIDSVVKLNSLCESGSSADKEISLGDDGLSLRVLRGPGTEGSGADLFLSVIEEDWLADDSEDVVGDGGALDGDSILSFEFLLLLGSHWLGDWAGHKVAGADLVCDRLHLEALEELELVHEALEGEGPSVTNGLEVLCLVDVNVKSLEGCEVGKLGLVAFLNKGWCDSGLILIVEDVLSVHVVDDESLASIEGEGPGVDVELWVGWCLVWVRDTSEVLDDALTCLLVKTLGVSLFADLE